MLGLHEVVLGETKLIAGEAAYVVLVQQLVYPHLLHEIRGHNQSPQKRKSSRTTLACLNV